MNKTKRSNTPHRIAAGFAGLLLLAWSATTAQAMTFSQWVNQFELPENQRGLEDNPSGDGVNNLLKFALGMNPGEPSRDGVPTAAVEPDGSLAISFSKNPDATGLSYIVEWSDDLVSWSTEGLTVVADTADSMTVAAAAGSDARFLRLRVPAPDDDVPGADAFLYVIGGRTIALTGAKNWDIELDRADTTTSYSDDPAIGSLDARSILIADVDTTNHTVTNWRRASNYLPDTHPEDPLGILHWTYMHNAVNVLNGRIYVGPATFNGTANEQGDGSRRIVTDIVVWAEYDPVTGDLGEFSASPRLPGFPGNQRIAGTAIVEVGGEHFIYILGGSSDAGTTDRVTFAKIDAETGAIGEWTASNQAMLDTDNFNAAFGYNGYLHNVAGFGATAFHGHEIWTTKPLEEPVNGFEKGDIYAENWWDPFEIWTITRTDEESFRDPPEPLEGLRWEQNIVIGNANGQDYVYIVGGARTGENPTPRVDGAALNPDGTFGEWRVMEPLPAPRRRTASAALNNLIILPGGSTSGSFAQGTDTVFIGVIQEDGNIVWSVSEEPMMQYRTFHGAAMLPAARD